jgi:hypothetical protein
MTAKTTTEITAWPVAGEFLQALGTRDFEALQACLRQDVRFRAMVPRGPFELTSAIETAARFRHWFGDYDIFDVLDAAIGSVGPRLYLRWRLRTGYRDAPQDCSVVEQHVFMTANERIHALDLLCSGFHAERPAMAPESRGDLLPGPTGSA